MINGGKSVAVVAGYDYCLYEAMRDLAGQFANGGMTIDDYLDALERLTADAIRKGVEDV